MCTFVPPYILVIVQAVDIINPRSEITRQPAWPYDRPKAGAAYPHAGARTREIRFAGIEMAPTCPECSEDVEKDFYGKCT